ncbi:o-succinylbenzoate--CoA ligase [Lapillicoccus sp.]|uniref:o-succinylbenzoate--CoA ligase n=1 Tax=Lapillicoccus sp. TaxID=1909287 RepID=UPI003265B81A
MTGLRRLEVPRDPTPQDVRSLLARLTDALGGEAPVLPVPAGGPSGTTAVVDKLAGSDIPAGVAVVVPTSGSTGTPKLALLTADALVASATATHEVLGGPGSWLLAMPGYHIAGLQVLVRSVVGGTTPCVLDLANGFDVAAFVALTAEMAANGGRRYTAVVPTQLTRLLDDPAGTRALASYDRVLVGGAATTDLDVSRAARAGVRTVLTYGMSETAGGCVYDGLPLPVSHVHIDNDHHVVLGGATVALGYLGRPGPTRDCFTVDSDGQRWFRTDDLGSLDGDGHLRITGRADDLINTGSLKVAPGPVEDAIVRFVPGVLDAVVVGTDHPTWGQAVSAAVTLRRGAPSLTVRDLRTALRGILPDHSLPHRLLVLDAIPLRGPGKPDRGALVAAFDETLGT